MKKKLLLIIGVLTLTLCFMLAVPSTKAQTNTRLVVQDYNLNAGTITFYDYDTYTLFGTYDYNNVYDNLNNPYITNKVNIPYIFRLGDIWELIDELSANLIKVKFIRPADRQLFLTLSDMESGLVYEYKGIVDNMYVFQQGFNFYKVPMEGVIFKNFIDGEYTFNTILKPGNQYVFVTDFGDIQFHFVGSADFDYSKGFHDGRALESDQIYNAYRDGYENGMRLAEGLLESEYQRGFHNGMETGYTNGKNEGYQEGFDDAYNEIISSDEYTLGYDNGFKAGEKSKIAKNNEAFYSGIEKWLVPAIIVVLVVGGIMSISALKRREQ